MCAHHASNRTYDEDRIAKGIHATFATETGARDTDAEMCVRGDTENTLPRRFISCHSAQANLLVLTLSHFPHTHTTPLLTLAHSWCRAQPADVVVQMLTHQLTRLPFLCLFSCFPAITAACVSAMAIPFPFPFRGILTLNTLCEFCLQACLHRQADGGKEAAGRGRACGRHPHGV